MAPRKAKKAKIEDSLQDAPPWLWLALREEILFEFTDTGSDTRKKVGNRTVLNQEKAYEHLHAISARYGVCLDQYRGNQN